MKIDRYTKGISARLDRLATNVNGKTNRSSGSGSGNNTDNDDGNDDEYYLTIGSEPPRFAYYRHVRIEQCTDEWKKLTMEAAIDSITQDELDFFLKSKLRMTPEERYQARKGECCWHESGWYHRGLNAYDGQGCNQFTGCVPECLFYPQYGRIEDEEVIKEHRQSEEYYRKRNMIVHIDIAANYNDYQEFLKM